MFRQSITRLTDVLRGTCLSTIYQFYLIYAPGDVQSISEYDKYDGELGLSLDNNPRVELELKVKLSIFDEVFIENFTSSVFEIVRCKLKFLA